MDPSETQPAPPSSASGGPLGAPLPKVPDDDLTRKEADTYTRWMSEIDQHKRFFDAWINRGNKIIKRYRDERQDILASSGGVPISGYRMNVLWSNIQTLQPACYSNTPVPNVSRRFADNDPVARTASLMLERALATVIEQVDFDYPMKRARDDYLLPGRGIVCVRYVPRHGPPVQPREPLTAIKLNGTQPARTVYRPLAGGEDVPPEDVQFDDQIGPYRMGAAFQPVLDQRIALDHVVWSDFLHEPVNDWTKWSWAGKRVLMDRDQLVERFGPDKGQRCKLTKKITNVPDNSSAQLTQSSERGEVYEIWIKTQRRTIWLSEGLKEELLDDLPDPLRLEGFWPFPKPIWATLTTDSPIPIPDYAQYQDQCEQIDELTNRLRLLVKAMRVVGLYNAEIQGLSSLLDDAAENEMLPIENWIAFAQAGGIDGNVDFLPLKDIADVLGALWDARAKLIQDVYQITGLSDIVRGQSAPSETATAQQIKGNFATLRLQDRQTDMAHFARDTLRLMAEVLCLHFDDQALKDMSGIAQTDDAANADAALVILRRDKMRDFRIDIETDATVAADQDKEKENRTAFIGAITPLMQQIAQLGQAFPAGVPLGLELLKWGAQGFRAGRSIEGVIDEQLSQFEQQAKQQAAQAQQPPQPPPPDPKVLEQQATQKLAQAKDAREAQEFQNEQGRASQKFAADMASQALADQAKQAEIAEANANIASQQLKDELVKAQTRQINEAIAAQAAQVEPLVPGDPNAALKEQTAMKRAVLDDAAVGVDHAALIQKGNALGAVVPDLPGVPRPNPPALPVAMPKGAGLMPSAQANAPAPDVGPDGQPLPPMDDQQAQPPLVPDDKFAAVEQGQQEIKGSLDVLSSWLKGLVVMIAAPPKIVRGTDGNATSVKRDLTPEQLAQIPPELHGLADRPIIRDKGKITGLS